MKYICLAILSVLASLLLVPGILPAGELMQGLEKDMAAIIARSKPFVVRVTTETGLPGMDMMEGLEDFFPHERRSGSGFIVAPDGHILTTENVVSGARRIIVTLDDESRHEARLVGKDPRVNVALLKIEAEKMKCAKIGDSDKIEAGSWVVCIGHPFGLSNSASFGIVSGKGRSGLGICSYEDFFQLATAIHPGDSGGPVINSRGEVVGIMVAALSEDWPFGPRAIRGPGDAFSMERTRPISFAIPINMAMDTVRLLKQEGPVERAWLGIHIQTITPELALAMGLSSTKGAIVVRVVEESPARKAGLERGDVIVSYGERKIRRASDLPYFVSRSPVGEPIEIEVIRGGESVTVKPVLERFREQEKEEAAARDDRGGIVVAPVAEESAARSGRAALEGVVVTSTGKSGFLKEGDVIDEVNLKKIRDLSDWEQAVRSAEPGDRLLIRTYRGYVMEAGNKVAVQDVKAEDE